MTTIQRCVSPLVSVPNSCWFFPPPPAVGATGVSSGMWANGSDRMMYLRGGRTRPQTPASHRHPPGAEDTRSPGGQKTSDQETSDQKTCLQKTSDQETSDPKTSDRKTSVQKVLKETRLKNLGLTRVQNSDSSCLSERRYRLSRCWEMRSARLAGFTLFLLSRRAHCMLFLLSSGCSDWSLVVELLR
ncbi:hypothetical protein CRUP_000999 [Coryphaenoides rupestris]|nr:hypothetical protein CRUP_000999 [Coryphaenoides rupestris]